MVNEQGDSGTRRMNSAEQKSELLAILLMAYFGVDGWIEEITTSTN